MKVNCSNLTEFLFPMNRVAQAVLISRIGVFTKEIRAKRDHEIALRKKGYLSKESDTVARVLILRYNEILGEEQDDC
jgi:hypothetical protein